MLDYDIIIGMDYMSTYRVSLNFFARTVVFTVPRKHSIVVTTSRRNSLTKVFLALIEGKEGSHDLANIPVIYEFEDVFIDIYWLPPVRELEFYIDLVLGMTHIYRSTYHMAKVEIEKALKLTW